MIKYQKDLFGYVSYCDPKLKNMGFVLSVDVKYSPKIEVYLLDTGETMVYKLSKAMYQNNPFDIDSVIKFYAAEKPKSKKVGNEWIKLSDQEWWITNYLIKTDW